MSSSEHISLFHCQSLLITHICSCPTWPDESKTIARTWGGCNTDCTYGANIYIPWWQGKQKQQQLPMTLGYAFTDYWAQGKTIVPAIVDIGCPPTGRLTPFNAYVALSHRCGCEHIWLLQDFNNKLFTHHPSKCLRHEDEWLKQLDKKTENGGGIYRVHVCRETWIHTTTYIKSWKVNLIILNQPVNMMIVQRKSLLNVKHVNTMKWSTWCWWCKVIYSPETWISDYCKKRTQTTVMLQFSAYCLTLATKDLVWEWRESSLRPVLNTGDWTWLVLV